MDVEEENYLDGEKTTKKMHPQQLLTDNMFIYDVENLSHTDKRRNILLAWMLRIFPRRTERML